MAKQVKAKGNDFERDICKALSLWFSKNERDDIFWRTAGSGSRATQRMKNDCLTTNSCGDVCALDKSGVAFINRFLIEIKRGYGDKIITRRSKGKETNSIAKGISLSDIVDRMIYKKSTNEPLLIQWLEKAKAEAKQNNIKQVIIIFKRDRKEPCIVISKEIFDLLQENNGIWIYPNHGSTATIHYGTHSFVVTKLDDFFHWCRPEAFFKKQSQLKRRNPWRHGKYGSDNVLKESKHEKNNNTKTQKIRRRTKK